jgi:hypothetical protein
MSSNCSKSGVASFLNLQLRFMNFYRNFHAESNNHVSVVKHSILSFYISSALIFHVNIFFLHFENFCSLPVKCEICDGACSEFLWPAPKKNFANKLKRIFFRHLRVLNNKSFFFSSVRRGKFKS